MSIMDNLVAFSSFHSLFKWFTLILPYVLWFPLVILFLRWGSRRNSTKCPASREIPTLKVPFLSIYGHLRTLPPNSVMRKTALSLYAGVLQTLNGHAAIFSKEPLFLITFGLKTLIALNKSEGVEELLRSNVILEKAFIYDMLHPWLNTGLLTSGGQKWKSRRKLLTHSFHFDILKEFLPSFNEQSSVLVGILKKKCHEEWIDIVTPITLCSLDIICETTLGARIEAQMDSESEYVAAVSRATRAVMERLTAPILHFDLVFWFSKLGRQFKRDVDCLHTFTRTVIKEKKDALLRKETHLQQRQNGESSSKCKSKRKALMDLLLDIHMKNQEFTEEDVREEIDTFAFEGHDTTSVAMNWALYLIGLNPQIQKKIHEELDYIYGNDQERPATADDLREMQYLECVLKESLRLYPSVPFFGRRAHEDINLCGYKIKKDSTVGVVPYILHRDPDVFPNPEKFDPDRFLPENCIGRSPFAYIPFSAGPRNCIGQRFAMMEEKTVISNVLRNFRIKSLEHRDKIFPACELILRSDSALKLKFTPRNLNSSVSPK